MKRFLFAVFAVSAVAFTSCNNDMNHDNNMNDSSETNTGTSNDNYQDNNRTDTMTLSNDSIRRMDSMRHQ